MQDKKTLITSIVLLAIFLPAAIFGTYHSLNQEDEKEVVVDDNPNHDVLYNGKVYFYLNNTLLGTYDCPNCTIVEPIIDDNEYHTNYYKDGNAPFPTTLNNNIALIHQNGKDYVYSIALGRNISNFDTIKTYNVEQTNTIVIAKNSNNWGVATLSEDALATSVEFRYGYISLPAHLIDGKLDTSKLIAKRDNYWYILNTDGTSPYSAFTIEIVDFNEHYYIGYDTTYHIYDYDNREYLANVPKNNVYATSKHIIVLNVDNSLSIYEDCASLELERISLPAFESIYFNETEAGTEIILDGNVYQTIA